jgi:putative tryptophan/tyrosine transport system substrate-binding protein
MSVRAIVRNVVLSIALIAMAAHAQQGARVARIGYLTPAAHAGRDQAFRDELASLGWVEGRNLVIERRSAEGELTRLPALAAELVRLNVDVIVAVVTQASVAAKAATPTIPIVIVGVGDPVGAGLVRSLARPDGNITGTSGAAVDVIGKQLEYLRNVRPGIKRVAALRNPANPVFQRQLADEARAAASKLGIELVFVDAKFPDLDDAFRRIAAVRPHGLIVLADPVLARHADRIGSFALEHKLPAVTSFETYTDAGLLLAYGANLEQFHRRSAVYVDRILRGAQPSSLPIERPTRFELIVNLRTARAIGVDVPKSVADRADRTIE